MHNGIHHWSHLGLALSLWGGFSLVWFSSSLIYVAILFFSFAKSKGVKGRSWVRWSKEPRTGGKNKEPLQREHGVLTTEQARQSCSWVNHVFQEICPFTQVARFIGRKLFITFPYYPFNICRICCDITTLIPKIGNLSHFCYQSG